MSPPGRVRIEKWVFKTEWRGSFGDLVEAIATKVWSIARSVQPPVNFMDRGDSSMASIVGHVPVGENPEGGIYNATVSMSDGRVNIILTTNSETVIARANNLKTDIKEMLGSSHIRSDDDELEI